MCIVYIAVLIFELEISWSSAFITMKQDSLLLENPQRGNLVCLAKPGAVRNVVILVKDAKFPLCSEFVYLPPPPRKKGSSKEGRRVAFLFLSLRGGYGDVVCCL